jgi:hypothetical protein
MQPNELHKKNENANNEGNQQEPKKILEQIEVYTFESMHWASYAVKRLDGLCD